MSKDRHKKLFTFFYKLTLCSLWIKTKKKLFQFLVPRNVKTAASASVTTSAPARTASAGRTAATARARPTARTAGSARCRTTSASAGKASTEQGVTKSKLTKLAIVVK
jgi:hypothetical protein